MALWEQLLVGGIALLVLLWVLPGLKPMLAASKKAPKDWPGLLIPIAAVIAFVIFLAATM